MRFQFPDGEMERWACLGAVTERSVRVWLREPELCWRTALLRIDGRVAAEAQLQPTEAHDGVAAADLTLAAPAPLRRFTVEVAGMERMGVLAPSPGAPVDFSFAFGSCHQPFNPGPEGRLTRTRSAGIYEAMLSVLRQRDVRFLALIGDQVYSDGVEGASILDAFPDGDAIPDDAEIRSTYRHLYRGYFNERGFRALLESFPTYMMWDDHDILDNWGSDPNPTEEKTRLYSFAAEVFREFQHLHNPGMGLEDRPPFDYEFWYGDLGFYVLDLRSDRSYDSGQVLGEGQWSRLEGFLRRATERGILTVFVVSTIPPVHFSPAAVRFFSHVPGGKAGNVRDRWDDVRFEDDRNRLLETLFDWQAALPERQVVVLSGDVHSGAAFRVWRRRGEGEVVQWTSSSMTAPANLGHWMINAAGTAIVNSGEKLCRSVREGFEPRNNFGVVDVKSLGEGRGHEIGLTIYGYDARRQRLRASIRTLNRPGALGNCVRVAA